MRDFVASTDHCNKILIAVSALPGGLFWRANSGLFRAPSGARVRANVNGCADIVGIYFGRGVAIEAKYGTGRLNDDQKSFRSAVIRAGGLYVVGRSVEQVLAELATVAPRQAAA